MVLERRTTHLAIEKYSGTALLQSKRNRWHSRENVPELQFRRRPPDASVSASEVLWGCGHRDGSLEMFGSASGASGLEAVGTALNKEISSNGEI